MTKLENADICIVSGSPDIPALKQEVVHCSYREPFTIEIKEVKQIFNFGIAHIPERLTRPLNFYRIHV